MRDSTSTDDVLLLILAGIVATGIGWEVIGWIRWKYSAWRRSHQPRGAFPVVTSSAPVGTVETETH